MVRPVVAITMGDPAGVGPEVILKALAHPGVRRACRPLVIGDFKLLERVGERTKDFPKLFPWEAGNPLGIRDRAIPVFSLSRLSANEAKPGRPSAACGQAAYRYIKKAAEMVLSGAVDAMATAPINKHVLRLAGYNYPGHTELLAELTRSRDCRMMLLGERLKVVLATGHLPLMRVADELTRAKIRITLELAYEGLKKYFGIVRPRVAVAALNPHGGEKGIFGREEKKAIVPAMRDAARRGIRSYGPFPADSLFHRAVHGDFDAVVCMYHDQGLIPLKLLHFVDGAAKSVARLMKV